MYPKNSFLFRVLIQVLKPFTPLYLWLRKKHPRFFDEKLKQEIKLDTSRMLEKFNNLHRLFFGKIFQRVSFNEEEIKNYKKACEEGPTILLMRNWGQVEYNYFNELFLKHELPLASHNNMIKMTHWMPRSERKLTRFKKFDYFFTEGKWLNNQDLFDLKKALEEKQTILFCLNLPQENVWIEKSLLEQREALEKILQITQEIKVKTQLVPLNFIYDKLPGKHRKSLIDIFLGERENPTYIRKVLLFLRRFKKRAVAKIGQPIVLKEWIEKQSNPENNQQLTSELLKFLQNTFRQEVFQVTGPKLKSRRRVIRELLESPQLDFEIQQFIQQGNTKQNNPEKIRKQLSKHFHEIISDTNNITLLELWDYALTWLFKRFYDGIQVDKKGIQAIKEVAKDTPVVIVPAHKSHLDYLIMTYVFHHNSLNLPHICAGNNLDFWPMGPLFRKSGAYFIRRSFGNDPSYKLALRLYVQKLLQENYIQEFFIEGTRSRSGKMFPPKLGFLSMLVDTYLKGNIPDIYFIPASIDYENIIEKKSYLKEIAGEQKKKEKTTDLFKLPKFLKKKYGKVYIQFAKPISLQESLGENKAKVKQESEQFKKFNERLAFKICHNINEVTTLLTPALVATALLSPREREFQFRDIHQKCEILFYVIKDKAVRVSEALSIDFHRAIQESLELFLKDGLIRSLEDLDGKFLNIPEEAVNHLNFFKNQAIYFFAELSLAKLCSLQSDIENPSDLFDKIRFLLNKEFFFSENNQLIQSIQNKDLTLPEWTAEIILPTLESYWLTLDTIEHLNDFKLTEMHLIQKTIDHGKLLKMKSKLKYIECLSKFNIQNAVRRLGEMGILRFSDETKLKEKNRKLCLGPAKQKISITTNLLEKLLKKNFKSF